MDYNNDACPYWIGESKDSLMKGNFFLKKSSIGKIKDILIIGLGKSGLSCIRYLSKQEGYKKKSLRISVYDKNKSIKDQKIY